ncbi:hypothetical protein LGX01_09765 [Streptococcus mutans]|jgi:hypothetical protein|uniref:hypothetical protein n=1 Tax=Streptococcus mutans TaxID=1309 RepID=UPI0002B51EF4|nr:hypothetical protein [Streptococcus mutans]EMB68639.1 hypothetical protein SMU29_03682 [Streptococcus mutans 2ST1]EMC16356.1 hypothetical protein SMU78_08752 [Streptococcus mutans W6]EMC22966.1 hypothetical protein SMU81_05283 [Streptococcus mutans SF14]EMC42315.1 hypothetical protein SMU98_07978 [Streptococcus mutans SM1]MCB4929314.1 hypothetical protein [Streptococcus mutans]
MDDLQRYTIFVANVAFEDGMGSKKRPVMLIKFDEEVLKVLKITSQFNNKSKAIQEQYFEIIDWFKAGLKRPSWIDTVRYYEITDGYRFDILGRLTERDIERFKLFIKERLD